MIVEAPLLALADAARTDSDAAAVFLDALLDRPLAWRDERVMMLCLGVPLDKRPPGHLGDKGRKNWRRNREESITFAADQWERYAARNDFARATTAVVLFGDWRTRSTSGGPPWPLARRADPTYQARLEWRRARAAGRRDRGVR